MIVGPITSEGDEHSNTGGIQEKIGQPSVIFDLDTCAEQGVGLNGLIGPFQLSYSMIIPPSFRNTQPSPYEIDDLRTALLEGTLLIFKSSPCQGGTVRE